MKCLASKNKSSMDRCESKALTKFLYCGRHLRCRKVSSWIHKHPGILARLIRIQALIRGFVARIPIRLGGKGILRRSECHNEEEIITLEGKTEVHPHDYFSIEENGKVYWFDQRSMIQWSQKELDIRNPYTRTVLEPADVRRLRKVWNYRQRNGLQLYHGGQRSPMTILERRDNRWLRIAQIVREHGFDIHHENFISMDIPQLAIFTNTMTEDTRWSYFETHDETLFKYHRWLKNIRNTVYTYGSTTLLSTDVATIVLTIMNDIRKLEDFVFLVYSAYYRTQEY